MSANSYGSVRRLNSLGMRSRDKGVGPDAHRSRSALFHEYELPVVIAHTQHVAIVAEVEEELARAFLRVAGQVGQEIHAVDMVLIGASDGFVALLQLVDHVGRARHREKGRQPVVMLDDVVGHGAGLDPAGPAYQQRYAERAFPVGVLLAPERCHAAIGPGVPVRTVIGASTVRTCPRRCRVRRADRASARRSCRDRSSCRGTATASGRPDQDCASSCA